MMVQTYFFKKGIPEHFDPEKGGYLKILGKNRKKRGVFEKFQCKSRGIEINMLYMYIYTI